MTKYSLLCPSRGRFNLLTDLLNSIQNTVYSADNVELLIAIDNDDINTEKFLNDNIININNQDRYKKDKYKFNIKIFKRERSEWLNRDYYNWLVQFADPDTKYLFVIGNDLVFKVKEWDRIIEEKIENYLNGHLNENLNGTNSQSTKKKNDRIACIGIRDNTPKPDIGQPPFPCFPIITREAFYHVGFILHPEIKTWGADKALYELYNGYNGIDRYLAINTDDLGNDVIYLEHLSYHTKTVGSDALADRIGEIYNDSPSYNTPNYVISYIIPRQVARLRGIIKDLDGRSRPHILIVTERWCDYEETVGLSNTEHNIIGSIESSELSSIDIIYHDYYSKRYKYNCDLAIIQRCIDSKPDMVFYSRCYEGSRSGICCPKWSTFGIIKNILKIPVVTIWWEAFDTIDRYSEYVDLNVVLQSTYMKDLNNDIQKDKYKGQQYAVDKYLLMWTPQDDRIFNRIFNTNSRDRDIDISFVGSIAGQHYIDRSSGLDSLKKAGINVFVSGGQRENKLSIDEYAKILKRSKIAINFASAGPGIYHAKGRIFEAMMCGCFLLESKNPETKLWFEPGIDYVEFKDNEDLVEKARYYLAKEHEEERLKIAKNGWLKSKELYNSKKFWNTIFDKIGIVV